MRCSECGKGKLKPATVEDQTRVGRWVITDPTARVFACGECGSWEMEYHEGERIEMRAALAVLMDHEEFDGAMLRDSRKILGMTQRDLAKKLGRRHETVCRDEQTASLDQELRFAMIGLLATKARAAGVTLEGVG